MDENEIKAITLAATPTIGFYVGVIVLAFVAPVVAVYGFLLIAIVSVLRARGDRSGHPRRRLCNAFFEVANRPKIVDAIGRFNDGGC